MNRLWIITLVLTGLMFGGCGQGESPQTTLEVEASNATYSYTDAAGRELTIPVKPQRVITLSEVDLDAMLALGVKPIASSDGRGQNSFPRYLDVSLTQGIVSVGRLGDPSYEAILAQHPDLILLGGFYTDQALEKLSAIAPVVVTYTMRDDWKVSFANIAKLLDRRAECDAFMQKYNAQLDSVRKLIGEHINDTVSIIRWNPKGPMFMYNTVFASKVIADIGLKRPEHQDKGGAPHSPILSLESLDQLDGDWIFMGTLLTEGEAVDQMKAATSTPAFAALKGVKSNQLVAVDGSKWTSLGGPLAAMQVLEDVAKAMGHKHE